MTDTWRKKNKLKEKETHDIKSICKNLCFFSIFCQLKLSNLHHLCNARREKVDSISSQQVSTNCFSKKNDLNIIELMAELKQQRVKKKNTRAEKK